MVQSAATTVRDYLAALPEDRRVQIETVRKAILEHLPDGYAEVMSFGMIAYVIPLERYPVTYNKQPLMYAALASQKNHMAVYLHNIYADEALAAWFEEAYRTTGKRMDIGKSCVRFRKLDDLPVALVGEAIARTSVDDYIALYERAREGSRGHRKKGKDG